MIATIVMLLAVEVALSFGAAFAENEMVNATKAENMTNATNEIATSQNCSVLRNCLENCIKIQNCNMFVNCTQNCILPSMRVTLETTGGFAGLTTTKTIDSDRLLPEQANMLRHLVDASGFFNLPETIGYTGPGRDFFQYKMTIESEGKKHTIAVDEPAASPELKTLIQFLKTIEAPA